ncbi:MAG: type II toxin-antitoxin system VapC family toxin [Acidimicrobiia bacterium]
MIAVDTNILVYAHRRDSQFHDPAAVVMRNLAQGRAAWAIPWPCLHEFLAVATHPRIYDPPTPIEGALAQVAAWLESPSLVLLKESADHWAVLSGLIAGAWTAGAQVHDARIAAICQAGGVRELWSADRDFSRFPLKVRNPLFA